MDRVVEDIDVMELWRCTPELREQVWCHRDIAPEHPVDPTQGLVIQRQMLTYLIVIYLSFLVFLGIIGALKLSFIPAIDQAAAQTAAEAEVQVTGGVLGGLGSVDTGAYQVLFFHVAAVQGLCSGLVAGLLGEGSLADGLKHATVLLVLSYLVFGVL